MVLELIKNVNNISAHADNKKIYISIVDSGPPYGLVYDTKITAEV